MNQLNNQLDFDDIFDLWQPAWWENPWVWVGVAVAIVVGAVMVYFLVRWYRSREVILTPHERALARLKQIPAVEALVAQEAYKHLYVELLAIVKEYCSSQHGYKISGKTDSELLEHMKIYANSSIFYPVVKQLVEHGLAIKFAQKNIQKERALEDYSFVLEAVSGDSAPAHKS